MVDSDEPSFDPRSWVTSAAPKATPEAAPTPSPQSPPPPPAEPKPVFPRQNLIGLGLSLAVLIAGGVTAVATHQKTPVAPVVAVAPSAGNTSSAGGSTRIMTLASADKLASALTASGLDAAEAQKATDAAAPTLHGHDGQVRVEVQLSDGTSPQLQRVAITFDDSSGTVVTRNTSGAYAAAPLAAQLKTVVIVKRGEMDTNSFYSSAVTAGITDSLITPFANAFAYDFDFQREIKPGDVFEAAFEETQNASGQVVGQPRLIYASLSTEQKSKALYFFTPPDGKAGWFDGNGASIIRSFLRTPIDGAHITSQFGMRVHPVLGFEKMHKGTDFGAPIGTPIYAAGDATVMWAAMKGPNGNLVILQHDNGWQTFYLHMSRFADGITPGIRVHQGQTIGYVGTTGRSTGPHLHYEMHINNEPVDAMTVPLEAGHGLNGDELTAFRKERDRIDQIRSQAMD